MKPFEQVKKEVGTAWLVYFPFFNQLHVMPAEHLQLYGDLDNGMILLPKFTIHGKKVVAPKTVEFQFVSYSDKKLFTINRKLTITVDDKTIFELITKLGLSKVHDDNSVTEAIVVHIPFATFVQLVNAKAAKIQLGVKNFELSSNQLSVLNDMKRSVDEGISFD